MNSISELEAIYGDAAPKSLSKVVTKVTPHYRTWIEASRFVVVSTVGAEGTDGSPRGDDGAVVTIQDESTLLLPDWFGNNRVDTLRNLVCDKRISLMFMFPSSTNVVRVNGTAVVTADEELRKRFEKKGKLPRTVIVITIGEMYFQCAKALMRSELWKDVGRDVKLPTAGDFLKERDAEFDGKDYDATYPEYAKSRMW
ncbi:MAG: pyridoxamine 5'-phosphate oxidase family protein [Planktotalea sp.]|uniref:pyridoxamine 5'-phosphate oxidase family protein n=1 Tax=Planktotalea sp. TaxID=2029877 RepID=UPI003C74E6FC